MARWLFTSVQKANSKLPKQKLTGLLLLLLILLLAACGGTEKAVVEEVDAVVETAVKTDLQADYANALTIQSQLALGTLKLEESPQAN